jgi:hypothetical protein
MSFETRCGALPRFTANCRSASLPHSIQGLEEGTEFVLAFDDGNFSENVTQPLVLLCPGRERPRSSAGEQRDELASPHSITSSARTSSVGGMSRPIALAVLRLITSSNLLGRSMGSSPALAPLRIRSV